jgi:hypothetical protein
MKHGSVVAFSEYVNPNTTVYTSLEHTALLSRADQLVLQAVVDQGITSTPGTISIAIEHCGDGRSWKQKNAALDLTGPLLSGQTTVLVGGEKLKPRPSLRFVRLSILHSSNLAPRVQVHVTARTFSRVWHEPCAGKAAPPSLPPLLGTHIEKNLMRHLQLPFSHRTMAELDRLGHDANHLGHEERHQQIAGRLSQEARQDLKRWVDQLRAMPPEEKRQMATNAGMMQMLLSLPANEKESLLAKTTMLRTLLTLVSGGPGGAAGAPQRAHEAHQQGAADCGDCEPKAGSAAS